MPEMSGQVAATVREARLHIVHGGPHFPNRTHRAEVQQALGAFSDEIGVMEAVRRRARSPCWPDTSRSVW